MIGTTTTAVPGYPVCAEQIAGIATIMLLPPPVPMTTITGVSRRMMASMASF